MDSSVISLGIILMFSSTGNRIEIWTTENEAVDGESNFQCTSQEFEVALYKSEIEDLQGILGMELFCDHASGKRKLFIRKSYHYDISENKKDRLCASLYKAIPERLKKKFPSDQFKYILFNA